MRVFQMGVRQRQESGSKVTTLRFRATPALLSPSLHLPPASPPSSVAGILPVNARTQRIQVEEGNALLLEHEALIERMQQMMAGP